MYLHCISSILTGTKNTESYLAVWKQLLSEFEILQMSLQSSNQLGAFCKDCWRLAMGTRWREVVTCLSAS